MQVKESNLGLVGAWCKGKIEGGEPAPEGFSPENAREWIKVDGEWKHDPEAAKTRREELEKDESG